MKFIKLTLGTLSLYGVVILFSSPFAGCVKETVRDTTVIRDTVRLHDTAHCEDLANGLIGYYNFTNGTLSDSSGLNNHITFNNATKTTDRFGNANNAYLFNGQNNYMSIKNHPSLNPKTISLVAIVKVNNFYRGKCEVNQIIGKGAPDNINGFYFMRFQDLYSDCDTTTPVKSNNEYFLAGYGDINQRSSTSADTGFVKLGQWYTVIYTFDGYESRVYVNGALKSIYVSRAIHTPNTFDVVLGRNQSDQYPYFFNGVIDEIRIYNKALCMEQVAKLSNQTK